MNNPNRKFVGIHLRNYVMSTKSGLTDAEIASGGPVYMDIIFDGLSNDQGQSLVDESVNRLFAREISRSTVASRVTLWKMMKSERRGSFRVADFASGGSGHAPSQVQAAIASADGNREEALRILMAQVDKEMELYRGESGGAQGGSEEPTAAAV